MNRSNELMAAATLLCVIAPKAAGAQAPEAIAASPDAAAFCTELAADQRVPFQQISGGVRKGILYTVDNESDPRMVVDVSCEYPDEQAHAKSLYVSLERGPINEIARFLDGGDAPQDGQLDKMTTAHGFPLARVQLFGSDTQCQAQDAFGYVMRDARSRLKKGGFAPVGTNRHIFRK